MSNILALDLSTKSSGWAISKDNNIYSGVIKKSSKDAEIRISYMTKEILKLIQEYEIDEIVAEEVIPDGEKSTRTGKVLMWLQGCLSVAVFHYDKNIKITFMMPSSWRSKIGIQKFGTQRTEQKKMDIEYANRVFNKNFTDNEDDEADALCILDAYMKNTTYKEPTKAF